MTAPQEVFQRAIRLVQDRDLDSYVELFADDGTLEFPFAPPGAPQRMQGRVEIRRSLGPLWQRARQSGRRVTGYDPVVVHNTTDPEVIVAEFTLHGMVEDRGGAATGCRMSTCTGFAAAGSSRSATTGTPWPSPPATRPPGAARAPGDLSRAGA
jgi:ketosteroid isomerase-like protein